MTEENICQEFRLKNIYKTRNYLIEEINQNKLISKKHKKICTTLNYIEHFLILASNKQQEASGLLSSLGIKTPLTKFL